MNVHIDNVAYDNALAICRESEPNLSKAYALLTKASQEGDQRATYALATWHLFGNDAVKKNEKLGVDILKSLEYSNIAEAIFDLAVSYDHGKGVRKNSKKAFSLYMRAALLGDPCSCEQISQYYGEGKVVKFDRSLEDAWRKRAKQDKNSISPPYRVHL